LPGLALCEWRGQSTGGWLSTWLKNADAMESAFTGYRSAGERPSNRIWRGAFPEVQGLSENVLPGWFLGYTSTYLQRDVRLLLESRDESQFATFLSLCAALTAQEVNAAQLGRDIGLAHTTARRWLDVLKGTYQWLELPAYTRNSIKRVSQRAKGHLWDTGLACHLMRISSPEAVPGHPAFGSLFESWVIGDCLRQLQAEATLPAAWHYRRHSGAEVDLVLERDGKLHPIEVKASSNPGPRDARGIVAFQDEYRAQAAPGLVVHAGERILRFSDRCLGIPFDLIREILPLTRP
jgi:predicted AAA+ superfamily ATPase